MAELNAKFSLEQRQIRANFSLEQTTIPAIFKINSYLDIVGEGVIDVVKTGGKAIVTSTTFIHEQGVATDTWVIEHNLGKYPSVTVIDTAGTVFTAQVEYIDNNNCIIYINGATKGKAYLN